MNDHDQPDGAPGEPGQQPPQPPAPDAAEAASEGPQSPIPAATPAPDQGPQAPTPGFAPPRQAQQVQPQAQQPWSPPGGPQQGEFGRPPAQQPAWGQPQAPQPAWGQPAPAGPGGWQPPPGGPQGGFQPPAQATPWQGDSAIRYSMLRVWLFSVVSFGLYGMYWFYVNRKLITRELGTNDNAGLQTAGLLVPVLNFFIVFWLWRDINEMRVRAGFTAIDVTTYTIGFVIITVVVGYHLGMGIFGSIMLTRLNEYWEWRTAGQLTDAKQTAWEWIVALLPPILFVTAITLAIIAAIAANAAVG